MNYINIGNGSIRFGINPYGNGIMMLVDRGIPCACNTQIFSSHTTNYYTINELQKSINRHKDNIIKIFDSFVQFHKDTNHILGDFGTLVCQKIVDYLAEKMEHEHAEW